MLPLVDKVVRQLGCSALAVALLQGCQSYTIVQRNVFVDDRGNAVAVEYGRSESEHVNSFRSPVNGDEMEFRSKLVVRAELPDGDTFKAWQCMNFLPYGTMYRTDNDEWMLHANGFTCTIYQQSEEDETKYREVFRGVLCDIDKDVKAERNEKWKDRAPVSSRERKGPPRQKD